MLRLVVTFLLPLVALLLAAQTEELHGKVADQGGVLVPGATVTATGSDGNKRPSRPTRPDKRGIQVRSSAILSSLQVAFSFFD